MNTKAHRTSNERDTGGPPGTYGCACKNLDARMCYVIRYDIDPADDDLDDGHCECLCHTWREEGDL